ncbi:MAG: hypothetical protein IPL11_15165 [Candidatus Accumulibacter sp.]|nr:hypothetical protein [Accumulibacter sp.]
MAAANPPVPTLYRIWKQPLMTQPPADHLRDVIRPCGGDNVFRQAGDDGATVTVEAVIAANPEAIVASGGRSAPEWPEYATGDAGPRITAAARGNLFFVPPDLI